MKYVSRIFMTVVVLFMSLNLLIAQKSISKRYKKKTIQSLSQLMNDHYIFPEVAKLTEKHLTKLLKEGYFDQFENDETFAAALTESVQTINKDKHMRIRKNKPFLAPDNSPEKRVEVSLRKNERFRTFNSGFSSVKILEGNVGYLDLRAFAHLRMGKDMADAYMKLLSNTDAIIIDLSKNGGGDPAMVQYLCSYFFDKKVHLNSLYFREGNNTIEFWTLDEVDGEKLPKIPLFVITGEKTFSGAEEFSYNMQTQKRATLIGQTTGGGANPGGDVPINKNLRVFIPLGKAINPITKTNWEGTGVIPEVKSSVTEALDTAHKLATIAAEKYRDEQKVKNSKLLVDLNFNTENSNEIHKALQACQKEHLIEEQFINSLGYEYLMDHKKPKIAESIFKANTIFYPTSSNVYDSYAEALLTNGNLESSLENYQKAVQIAIQNEEVEDIEWYKKNVTKVRKKLGKK